MVNPPPPAYEEPVTRRVDRHYLTCTRPGNEESLKPSWKRRVDTFALRGWVASNGGTTVAVGPWWMKNRKPKTWEVSKPTTPDQITKTIRSTRERLIQALRRLRNQRTGQEAASIFAINGTPIQSGEIEYTIDTANLGEHDWTKKWGWMVKLIACTYAKHVGCSRWTLTCRMFIEDLPSLLQAGGIPWKNVIVHSKEVRFDENSLPKRQWKWARTSFYSPTSTSRQKWQTRVDERHWKQSSLELDFRYRLSTETVKR
ncbi:hypothetical protein CEP54_001995 [Fusarium duplospermum]|uniref:Uncharacterized protein n=1 Tax=Fusarium duplospermum TaxID=1325734 RepID=A0A428QXN3_9HYPO|nr:hypothetical protein CEP54_001995 [Fusarium duplospermum]